MDSEEQDLTFDQLVELMLPEIEEALARGETWPEIEKEILASLNAVTKKHGRSIAEAIRQDSENLAAHRADDTAFLDRLNERWGLGFDSYFIALRCSLEVGGEFNHRCRPKAAHENDFRFAALSRLHAIGCRIAGEVLCLVEGGFADAARARWRTVYESAVVGCVVAESDQETAERYLLHEVVQNAKDAREYQRHCVELNEPPYADDEMAAFEANRQGMISRFGDKYDRSYGWAAHLPGVSGHSFVEVERTADFSHMRPHFSRASHGVHAGSKAVAQNASQRGGMTTLIAVRMNAGLASPAIGALRMLNVLTCSFVIRAGKQWLEPMDMAAIAALMQLTDHAAGELSDIEETLNADERRVWGDDEHEGESNGP